MSEEELIADAKLLSRWQQHKFMVMVAGTIVIALILVAVSLRLYRTSGAALLDLSRPGYQAIRDQVTDTSDFKSFPSTGEIDHATLDAFRAAYSEQLERVTPIDGFGGDVLSDASLGLELQQ